MLWLPVDMPAPGPPMMLGALWVLATSGDPVNPVAAVIPGVVFFVMTCSPVEVASPVAICAAVAGTGPIGPCPYAARAADC